MSTGFTAIFDAQDRISQVFLDIAQAGRRMESTFDSIGSSGNDSMAQVSSAIGTTSSNGIQDFNHLSSSGVEAFSQIENASEDMSTSSGGALDKLGSSMSALKGVAGGLVAAFALDKVIDLFNEADAATRKLQASTGVVGDEATQLQSTLRGVYADNFGTDWDDVATSVATVNQFLKGTGEDVKAATENALGLRDVFEYDVNESMRANSAIMKNFGVTSEQAFNLIAQGSQQGLNFSGELLDNISEYSVQFGKFGFGAEDMFNIFSNGAKNGAINLDKVGDAVKEFSIRAIDGSNTTIDGFTKLGMSSDDMAKKFGAGGDTAKNAFYETIKAIKAIDDPVKQSIVGVDLFGTQWEDLGAQVITSLGDVGDGFDKTKDSMAQINKIQYSSFSSALEGIGRQLQVSLLMPIGDALLPVLSKFSNWFAEIGTPAIQAFGSFLSTTFSNLGTFLSPFVDEGLKTLGDFWNNASTIFQGSSIESNLTSVGETIQTKLQGVFEKLPDIASKASAGFSTVVDGLSGVRDSLLPVIESIVDMFTNQYLPGIIDNVVATIDCFTELGVFWSDVVGNTILPCVAGIVDAFQTYLMPIVSDVIGYLVNDVFPILRDAMLFFTTTILPILKEGFETIFPQIQSIVENCFIMINYFWNSTLKPTIDAIMAAFAFAWPFIKGYVEAAVTQIIDIFGGLFQALNGVIEFITGVFTGDWSKAWQGVKDIFGGCFNALAGLVKGPINAVIGLINGAFEHIGSISVDIPDWIPEALGGGKHFGISLPKIPMLAQGTDFWKGGKALVGEAGPEIVSGPQVLDMASGSKVMSAKDTKALLSKSINSSRNSGSVQNTFIFQAPNMKDIQVSSKEELLEVAYQYIVRMLEDEIDGGGDSVVDF